ncbi:MAG: metallophosphoesterase [Fibrella sp.]|nr:metallophosphoesterase [Armatimonadota bacterium]
MHSETQPKMMNRRQALFLGGGTLLLLAVGSDAEVALAAKPVLRLGLITDVHYADADTKGTRYYRESLGKMREAVTHLNGEKVDVAVALGDLIDTPNPPDVAKETGFLKIITGEFGKLNAPRHFVLGNHCVSGLTKAQFLAGCGQSRSYYSFDKNGVHCVVLDACFRADGTAYAPGEFKWTDTEIPAVERDWLEKDLQSATGKVLVFVHQRLDAPKNSDYLIHSAPAVRTILEKSGKVLAVFQGHSHQNELQVINTIPYLTMAAMIEGSGPENSGYSVLGVHPDNSLTLTGFRKHAAHPFAARKDSADKSARVKEKRESSGRRG